MWFTLSRSWLTLSLVQWIPICIMDGIVPPIRDGQRKDSEVPLICKGPPVCVCGNVMCAQKVGDFL